MNPKTTEDAAELDAVAAFEREVGVTGVPHYRTLVGNREFLKFEVGKSSPLYDHALFATQKAIGVSNTFYGSLGLAYKRSDTFPSSVEASSLLTLLTRSTRILCEGGGALESRH
jgi:hypothetical protein